MIRLNTVTRKLQAVLAGAVTTNQLPITVCYTDATTTSWLGGTTVINTNSTTPVDICAAPAASTVRDIDYLSVRNSDTVPATVTIRYNDNATLYTLFTATLAAGDILIYVHGSGVHVLDSSGAVKSTVTFAGISVASGKNVTMLKSMTLTAADDTGVYTFPTGTASIARIDAAQTFAGAQAFSTSVSTPSILTASGALGITPAAGSGVNISLSTTGDFAVNTNQLYVDTSSGFVGIGVTPPLYKLHLSASLGLSRYTIGAFQNLDSTGSAEFAFLNDGGQVGSIGSYGTGTGPGIGFPNSIVLRSDTNLGMYIIATHASGALNFYTGGTSMANSLRMKLSPTGGLSFGKTYVATNPGDGNVIISGTVGIGTTGVTAGSTLTVAGIIDTTDATDATSATAASLKTAGGIASVKGAWIGGASRLVGAVTMDSTLTLTATATPTGTGAGAVGQIAWDTAYLYICTAANDWRRIALVDF